MAAAWCPPPLPVRGLPGSPEMLLRTRARGQELRALRRHRGSDPGPPREGNKAAQGPGGSQEPSSLAKLWVTGQAPHSRSLPGPPASASQCRSQGSLSNPPEYAHGSCSGSSCKRMAEANDHTPVLPSLFPDQSCIQKKTSSLSHTPTSLSCPAQWRCHLSAHQAEQQQQQQHRESGHSRRWEVATPPEKPFLRWTSEGKQLGAPLLPSQGSDHSLPELPRCDSLTEGLSRQGWPWGLPVLSPRPPLPNTPAPVTGAPRDSCPPRFPPTDSFPFSDRS